MLAVLLTGLALAGCGVGNSIDGTTADPGGNSIDGSTADPGIDETGVVRAETAETAESIEATPAPVFDEASDKDEPGDEAGVGSVAEARPEADVAITTSLDFTSENPALADFPDHTFYRGHNGFVAGGVELPGGLVATRGADETVQVWDPKSPEETLVTYDGHRQGADAMLGLPDGRVVSLGGNGEVHVWNPAAPGETAVGPEVVALAESMVLAPDGRVAIGAFSGVYFFNVDTWEDPVRVRREAQQFEVLPDGELVLMTRTSETVKVWYPPVPEDGRYSARGTGQPLALRHLGDGVIATAYASGAVHTWSAETTEQLSVTQGPVPFPTAMFLLGNGWVASVEESKTTLWPLGDPTQELVVFDLGTRPVQEMFLLRDGRVVSVDGGVRIWKPSAFLSGQTLADVVPQPQAPASDVATSGSATSLGAAPSGTPLQAAQGGTVESAFYSGHVAGASVALELRSRLVASADQVNGEVHVWDPANPGSALAVYSGHSQPIQALGELRDGRILSAGLDSEVHLWHPDQPWETLGVYRGHSDWISDLHTLANGRVASASHDGTVQVWDPDDPSRALVTFDLHNSTVWGVAERPDTRLVSGGDSSVLVWDPDALGTVQEFRGHTSRVLAVSFLFDGRVASGDETGSVLFWHPDDRNVPIEAWVVDLGQPIHSLQLFGEGEILAASLETVAVRFPDPAVAPAFRYSSLAKPIFSASAMRNGQILISGIGGVEIWSPTGRDPLDEVAAAPEEAGQPDTAGAADLDVEDGVVSLVAPGANPSVLVRVDGSPWPIEWDQPELWFFDQSSQASSQLTEIFAAAAATNLRVRNSCVLDGTEGSGRLDLLEEAAFNPGPLSADAATLARDCWVENDGGVFNLVSALELNMGLDFDPATVACLTEVALAEDTRAGVLEVFRTSLKVDRGDIPYSQDSLADVRSCLPG